MVDDLIGKKVENPGLNVKDSEVIKITTKLVQLDGLDA
jgi:ATP-dependent RNA helicase DHX57